MLDDLSTLSPADIEIITRKNKEGKNMIMEINAIAVEKICHHWNKKMPMMAMEECGELIQAISKMERKDDPLSFINLQEEIRDMFISLACLMKYYDMDQRIIESMINKKINTPKDK